MELGFESTKNLKIARISVYENEKRQRRYRWISKGENGICILVKEPGEIDKTTLLAIYDPTTSEYILISKLNQINIGFYKNDITKIIIIAELPAFRTPINTYEPKPISLYLLEFETEIAQNFVDQMIKSGVTIVKNLDDPNYGAFACYSPTPTASSTGTSSEPDSPNWLARRKLAEEFKGIAVNGKRDSSTPAGKKSLKAGETCCP